MNTEEKFEKPTLRQLWQDIKKHKSLYYKVLSITFVVVAFITLCIPNYYTCTVKLAPELSGSKGTSSLASIASSFGFNVGNTNLSSDAILPTLYPDLINSVAFRASLFPIKVQKEEEDSVMTYYEYLLYSQSLPWWTIVARTSFDWIKSFIIEKEEPEKVNPFKLTKEQYSIVKEMEKKVICNVDKRTLVITINVTDNDPLIAATMADSVQVRLQDYITDYRTRKARIDLAYNQKLFQEAKDRYEKARKRYAAYSDANRYVLFENKRSERTELENEMQIQYRIYSQVVAQLQLAEAKVQEDTPAFTTLQPATVPVKKEGPKRSLICLIFLVFAFSSTSIYAVHKEKHLFPYLGII